MRRYYYRLHDMWLSGHARSRKQILEMIGIEPEELLTESQALRRAEKDPELADCIQSSFMCALMCP